MQKIWIILAILLGLILSIVVFSFLKRPSQESSSALLASPQPLEEKFELATWEDPAGFSFDYPEILEIDTHEEDETNYAHLELTRPGKKGRILIIVNDSDYSTLDEWLAEDKEVKGASSLDTEIASISAKKVALKEGREITAFIDLDQVIYKIIKEPEGEEFWRQTYNIILNSFKFIPLEGETQAEFQDWLEGFETSSVDVVEPVEIIQ